MNNFYNKAFNVGVLFSLFLFTITNFLSYFAAYLLFRERMNEYENNKIKMSGSILFPQWGFPFSWFGFGTYFSLIPDGVLNLVFLAICGFVFGFIFKFVWSKIAPRRVKLK